ncbi:MAG: prepilin peptidase [Actinomycetes bacterium]|jgi:leader peptidase (prepilin peptidase)/N-methyltransferase
MMETSGSDALIVAVLCGVLGLFIGSFLNVVIYRVPLGESVVSPRSRCTGCGSEIAAHDNIPVLSWLWLRGHCRSCGQAISVRYPLVELLTGIAFAAVAWWAGPSWQLPAYLYLAAIGVALSAIDLDTRRLPNVLVLPSYPVAIALLVLPAAIDGNWEDFLRAILGGAAVFCFYFVLALIYPAGMGFGDVKLSGVLGIYLGWVSWGVVIVGTFAGFLLGALVGIAVMLAKRGGRKTALPFGPFMVVGTFIALGAGPSIVSWYLTGLGS